MDILSIKQAMKLGMQLCAELEKIKKTNSEATLCLDLIKPVVEKLKLGEEVTVLPCGYFFLEGSLANNDNLVECYLALALELKYPEKIQNIEFMVGNNYFE